MLPKETLQLILDTGRGQNAVQKGDTGDAFFIRPDGSAQSLRQFFKPTRVEAKVNLTDADSFCEYFKRFSTNDSMIFGNVTSDGATFRSIMDYHGFPADPDQLVADYCDHIATFSTKKTPEWEAWLKANRKPMSQIEFATWLEDNLHLFAAPKDGAQEAPSPADLLELVKSLHGHQNATFNTSIRLDNGAHSCSYEEAVNVQGTMRGGAVVLPPFVYGGFPLFQGMPGYLVQARLKSRIENRKLVLFFETVALEKMIQDCLDIVIERIEEKTERSVLIGDFVGE